MIKTTLMYFGMIFPAVFLAAFLMFFPVIQNMNPGNASFAIFSSFVAEMFLVILSMGCFDELKGKWAGR